MKNSLSAIILAASLFSCTDDSTSVTTPTPIGNGFYPLTAGSTWTYEITGDGKTITAKDSVIGTTTVDGKQYTDVLSKVYSNVTTETYTESYRRSNDTLFILTQAAEAIMLIEKQGASWTSTVTNPNFVRTTTASVVQSGLTLTVNGTQFKDVMQIRSAMAVTVDGTTTESASDLYYAKNIGLIEQITPDVIVRLKSYSIK